MGYQTAGSAVTMALVAAPIPTTSARMERSLTLPRAASLVWLFLEPTTSAATKDLARDYLTDGSAATTKSEAMQTLFTSAREANPMVLSTAPMAVKSTLAQMTPVNS